MGIITQVHLGITVSEDPTLQKVTDGRNCDPHLTSMISIEMNVFCSFTILSSLT